MFGRIVCLGLAAVAVQGCTSSRSAQPVGTVMIEPAQVTAPAVMAPSAAPSAPMWHSSVLPPEMQRAYVVLNTGQSESYDAIADNTFQAVAEAPLSTFSVDVDTASYANVRRMLNADQLPPADAVRVEEMINYFDYAYAPPSAPGPEDAPFSAHIESMECPWAPAHRLVKIGLKGWEPAQAERPRANLVFLIDVSGSMAPANKLPLVKESLRKLVNGLRPDDRVAIAVYASSSGLVLPSTEASESKTILDALDRLESGGSTNGGEGIQLAYGTAREHFIEGGVNRVILATDGDFNVGITDRSELTNLIEREAKSGVFLSILGFGMGNLKDGTLEELSGKGNGTYAYIDTEREAHKVFGAQLTGSLMTIAKDVKIQVEFNPATVNGYRLIGYENRILADEDFNDDTKDAGDIGAGHTVTALYEVVPAGVAMGRSVDPLKYQPAAEQPPAPPASGELLTVKVRYKRPDGDTSSLLAFPFTDRDGPMEEASPDLRFAAGVAAFGMVLRDSQHKGAATMGMALDLAGSGHGEDPHGYRSEFMILAQRAGAMLEKRGG